ncbi:MAG TPA: DUF1707 domain-containing protein [Solirubrobacteraceae bacterium]|jgi:hypothetical protein|nr:DUF1707 domain-containing protein [Solirubrobacteraceae bacterium]
MLTRDRTATMRTSEAERQRVADFLRDCCAEGRLSPEELEDRLDLLYEGGTVAHIRRLVADLPGGDAVVPRYGAAAALWRAAPAPPPAPPTRRLPRGLIPLLGFAIAAVLFASLPLLVKALTLGVVLVMVMVGVAIALAVAPFVAAVWGIAWVASRVARAREMRPS